jgi:N6-adenosine-specific RNA methylase IME4
MNIFNYHGFKVYSKAIWVKMGLNGSNNKGVGFRLRNSHEELMIGYKGNFSKIRRGAKFLNSVLFGLSDEHSRKPHHVKEIIENLNTNGPLLEIFARDIYIRDRPWTYLGNQL